MERKKVLIVEDHSSVREGVRWILLSRRLPFTISEAQTIEEGYGLAVDLEPDLIIMDISVRGASGIELSRRILQVLPRTAILVLSMYSRVHYIVKALEYGVKGYVLKESPPEVLVKGVQKVLEGELFIDSRISNKVIGRLLNREAVPEVEDEVYASLTPREQEILRLLAEGVDVKEIGRQLFISAKTVENHRTHIMAKLGCRNAVELIRYAAHIGLVDL